jgi:hypothetical protein
VLDETTQVKESVVVPDDNLVELKTLPILYRSSFVRDLQGDVTRMITSEWNLYQDVRLLMMLVRRITDSKGPWFEYAAPAKPYLAYRIKGEKNFHDLVTVVRRDWSDLYAMFPKHSFNPYVAEFFAACKEHPWLLEMIQFWPKVSKAEAVEIFADLGFLVEDLRRRTACKEFRRLLHRIARRCRKNYRGGLRYIRRQFESCSRLLVFRVELGYSSCDQVAPAEDVSAAQVRSDLAKLQRYLRETFPATGFMWKLEYGMLRGHHFHVLVFMNGHLVQQDQAIGKQFKQYWESDITRGRGTCYVCKPGDYEEPGIGMINYYDEEKRGFLEKNVLPYLVKADFWMSYEPGGRTFGRGLMPPGDPRTGRPRGRH